MKHKAEMVRDASLGKGEVESSILSGSTIKSTAYADNTGPALCRTGQERAPSRGKKPAKPACARGVMCVINKDGSARFYHRRKGFKVMRVSAGVDVADQGAVDADFHVQLGAADMSRQYRQAVGKFLAIGLKKAKDRAKNLGRECSITIADLEAQLLSQRLRCALSGLHFDLAPRRPSERTNPMRPSIDRIDSARGYTPDNVQLVLVAVNLGKGEWDVDVYKRVCRAVARRCAGVQNVG